MNKYLPVRRGGTMDRRYVLSLLHVSRNLRLTFAAEQLFNAVGRVVPHYVHLTNQDCATDRHGCGNDRNIHARKLKP